jgi:hypothetical protein
MLILIIINVHGILAIYWTNRTGTWAENALYCPHDVMVKPLRYQSWAEMLDYINAQFNCLNMRGNMYVINKVHAWLFSLTSWMTNACLVDAKYSKKLPFDIGNTLNYMGNWHFTALSRTSLIMFIIHISEFKSIARVFVHAWMPYVGFGFVLGLTYCQVPLFALQQVSCLVWSGIIWIYISW